MVFKHGLNFLCQQPHILSINISIWNNLEFHISPTKRKTILPHENCYYTTYQSLYQEAKASKRLPCTRDNFFEYKNKLKDYFV